MTENERLIHGSYGEQRYLHSDEIFRKERNWNINLPSEREFKDGYCIITDKDNTAYSIDELVELLNEFQKENKQLKKENKKLQGEYDKQLWLYNGLGCEYDWLKKENEELKQPNCRKCIHFSCDTADNYCMEKEYDSIPDCSIAKDCDEYDDGVHE